MFYNVSTRFVIVIVVVVVAVVVVYASKQVSKHTRVIYPSILVGSLDGFDEYQRLVAYACATRGLLGGLHHQWIHESQ